MQGGLVASMLSGVFFGGIAPFVFSMALGRVPKGRGLGLFVFLCVLMGWRGMEVDLLYQFLAWLWGDTQTVAVVVKKAVFDQCLWSVLYSGPTTAALFLWRDHGFSWKKTKPMLFKTDFLKKRLLPMYIATWMTWVPTMPLVFSLPLAVQFPVFCLVLCFFVLLITALEDGKAKGVEGLDPSRPPGN